MRPATFTYIDHSSGMKFMRDLSGHNDKQLAPAVHERLTGSIYLTILSAGNIIMWTANYNIFLPIHGAYVPALPAWTDLCMHIVVLCLVNTHTGMCGYNYHCVLCSTVVNDSRMPLWYIDIRCCRTDCIQSHCEEIK